MHNSACAFFVAICVVQKELRGGDGLLSFQKNQQTGNHRFSTSILILNLSRNVLGRRKGSGCGPHPILAALVATSAADSPFGMVGGKQSPSPSRSGNFIPVLHHFGSNLVPMGTVTPFYQGRGRLMLWIPQLAHFSKVGLVKTHF